MAVQYPKSTHVTLPSVEQWAQNTNILKDPLKSITTRRVDKVGQTQNITQLVDDSGDRICEGINVYQRGVNPMVSVSYENNGGNAGIAGNPTSYSNRPAARMPYPAFQGGAFRPPVRTERDLMPLSRQPRAWFGTVTAPEFINYAKTRQQPNDFRAVKELMVHAYDVKPNKTTIIDKGILKNFDMADHINDQHISLKDTTAGKEWNYFSSYTKEHADIKKGALDEVLHADAVANKGRQTTASLEGYEFNPSKYISENAVLVESYTNPSASHSQTQGLQEVNMQTGKYISTVQQIEQQSNVSRVTTQNLDEISIQNGRYIQDVNQIETVANRSRLTTQNMDDVGIQSDRYIQDVNQFETSAGCIRSTMQGVDDINIQSDRYIQGVNQIEQNSNISGWVQAKKLDELFDNGRVAVKNDMIHYAATAGKTPTVTFLNEIAQPELEMRNPMVHVTAQRTQTDVAKRVDHEKDHRLYRHTPMTDARTNITKIDDFNNIQVNMASRTVQLDPLLRKGGFQNVGNKPTFERSEVRATPERLSDKDIMRNRMNEMQFNRY